MENHNQAENPWNMKLQTIDGKLYDNSCKVLMKRGLMGRFSFLKNMPHLFNKFDDLILCNICHILVCKKRCLKHAKFHEKQKEDANFSWKNNPGSEMNDVTHESDVNKRLSNQSPRQKLKSNTKDKKRKLSSDKKAHHVNNIKNNDKLTHFVPKSTLNAANPLRIRIQLQPKLEPSPKNGNIFENMNNFYHNFKNNNLCRSAPMNVYDVERGRKEFDPIDFVGLKEHRHAPKARSLVVTDKIHCETEIAFNGLRPPSTVRRACGTTSIISGAGPEYLRHNSHQTSTPSSLSTSHHRIDSPHLSKQPQLFQSFRRAINPGKTTTQKKYVKVKSLCESLLASTATQSTNPSNNNLDQNQMSFQKILIDNGMFSQDDILRCQRPNTVLEIGHSGKIRRVSNLPGSHSMVRVFPNNSVAARSITGSYPRFPNNNYAIRPFSQRPSGLIMTNSDPLLASRASFHSSNIRNHNTHSHHRSMDLSDDEFFLDSTVGDDHNAQIGAHSLRGLSADVHYLPPPEETITSLSWEQ